MNSSYGILLNFMSVSTVVDVIDRSVECLCEIGLFWRVIEV